MSWTENEILLNYTKHTPCNDIFKAVCNEIGKKYAEKGYKYSRSRPKIKTEDERIKLEISFWSSGRNILGEYVNLEILPSFYSKTLKNNNKEGFLFGHVPLFYHKYTNDKTKIKVNQIYGDILERTDKYSHESIIIDNNNCNIYGVDENKFRKILNFIDTKIIIWFKKIQDEIGVIEFLENASETKKYDLRGDRGNTNFIEYMKLNFPKLNVEKLLK
ncbi:MAG: hypothetical protein LBH44_12445 [Treponema sp.]|jgi:hypothetical protein|nr:hypothetical protein [Treponema sp.]